MGNYKMIDVSDKNITKRIAIACGKIQVSEKTIELIKTQKLPKGDVLKLAEASGIMAAKKTSDILPLCHPLALDAIYVRTQIISPQEIEVECEVITTSKTGVEMEALTGVSAALLCIYDLCKIVDPVIEISQVYLKRKEGGKSGIYISPLHLTEKKLVTVMSKINLNSFNTSFITLSDSRTPSTDESGLIIKTFLKESESHFIDGTISKDDISEIKSKIKYMIQEFKLHLLITTGGTGVGPRDVTPEALKELNIKEIPGIGELLRSSGALHNVKSYLSRSFGGFIEKTLVISLPGSPKAVNEGLQSISSLIPHLLHIAHGGGH